MLQISRRTIMITHTICKEVTPPGSTTTASHKFIVSKASYNWGLIQIADCTTRSQNKMDVARVRHSKRLHGTRARLFWQPGVWSAVMFRLSADPGGVTRQRDNKVSVREPINSTVTIRQLYL